MGEWNSGAGEVICRWAVAWQRAGVRGNGRRVDPGVLSCAHANKEEQDGAWGEETAVRLFVSRQPTPAIKSQRSRPKDRCVKPEV